METFSIFMFLSFIIVTNFFLMAAAFRPLLINTQALSNSKYPSNNAQTWILHVALTHLTAQSSSQHDLSQASLDPPAASHEPFESSPIHQGNHLHGVAFAAIILLPICLGFIIIFSFLYWYWFCRSSFCKEQDVAKGDHSHPESSEALSLWPWLKRLDSSFRIARKRSPACALDYSLLQAATNNFSTDNLLGRGGFSWVYKARFDDDFFAAVKRLDNLQKHVERNFQAEVQLMNRIRHPNLVSLLGYSIRENQHLLVYELMQNGSLEDQLHGPARGSALNWNLRMKIALDSARGLEHLHECCQPAVIHRDFKSSNILLDASFNAKVSDFGLAIISPESTEEQTIELQGTFGYVAPEYLLHGTLSEKSDVYAFGVVLLELITGRKPIDKTMPTGCQSLVTWAAPQLTDASKLAEMLDPAVQKNSVNLKHLHQVAAIAVLCVQSEPSYRPLITDVVNSLIPLVPIDLGGALRNGEPRAEMEMVNMESPHTSQKHMKSFSFSHYSSRLSESQGSIKVSMSERMLGEFSFSGKAEWQ